VARFVLILHAIAHEEDSAERGALFVACQQVAAPFIVSYDPTIYRALAMTLNALRAKE
jgi:hypothetical protein